jgi:hypothetical protein
MGTAPSLLGSRGSATPKRPSVHAIGATPWNSESPFSLPARLRRVDFAATITKSQSSLFDAGGNRLLQQQAEQFGCHAHANREFESRAETNPDRKRKQVIYEGILAAAK